MSTDAIYATRNFMNGPAAVGKVEWTLGFMRSTICHLFGVDQVPGPNAQDRFYGVIGSAPGGLVRFYGVVRKQDGHLAAAHMSRDGFLPSPIYVVTHRPYSGQKHDPRPRGEDASVASVITGAENLLFLRKDAEYSYSRFTCNDVEFGTGFIEFKMDASLSLQEKHDGEPVIYNPSRLPALHDELVARGFLVQTVGATKKSLTVWDQP